MTKTNELPTERTIQMAARRARKAGRNMKDSWANFKRLYGITDIPLLTRCELEEIYAGTFWNTEVDPRYGHYCQCCGAVEGKPHHDPDYTHVITNIVRHPRRRQYLCQICREGLDQLAAERKAR